MIQNLKQVLTISDQIRNDIRKECKISNATLWNWSNGRTPIPFWAKEIINEITKDALGKELFTEQEIEV